MIERLPAWLMAALAGLFLATTIATALAGEPCVASWYERGRLTASGERFNPDGLTAALRSRAFGRHLRVTHLDSGRAVIVRHNDYGPAQWTGRCIDLSRGAFRALGIDLRAGVARVRIDVLD